MISLRSFGFTSSGLLAIWGIFVCAGILFLQCYVSRPGLTGSPPARWPRENTIARDIDRSTLLIFLDPLCPCSQASIEELGYIMNRCGHRVRAYALLLCPTQFPEGWDSSRVKRDLEALPDVAMTWDRGGAEARRFRVETSGHVVLYDARGRLAYSGGITPARGHRGDNFGRAAVIDRIFHDGADPLWRPVFGCPLSTTDPADGEEVQR